MAALEELESPSFESLFHTSLVMNDVIHFGLSCPLAKDPFQKLLSESFFQSLCEINGNTKRISASIKSLLAEPTGIQRAYEDYTQLFIGLNSLPAPPMGIGLFRL
ncbi:hypothetical protein AC623_10690 [Bacillus sp. FJAT-27231]|uniref:hypothetical protein n=1 Tax=Bacillus sp. FJAT-27231 TaxID=1679168 RepID=UPI0006713A03|nr:hypothetical protein [Bacillus sp. FJAT-27231]KMY54340.1 hypothetical protein AC623_10690 [Bacillus sp. FJAT-27231]